MNVVCRTLHAALPTVGGAGVTGPLGHHVELCRGCSAEAFAYAAMHRQLDGLDPDRMSAPEGFTNSVLASLGPVGVESEHAKRDSRVPVAAVAALATAAAGTVMLVKLYRQRAA